MDGTAIAKLGLALCAGLCGVGSAIGLYNTGSAAAGVLAEDKKKFGRLIGLVVLPATQGIYGFVLAIIGQSSIVADMTLGQGWAVFAAVLPLTITGLISGIFQGKTSVSGIYALAKEQSLLGRLIMFPAMVETYAILGLVISILLLNL